MAGIRPLARAPIVEALVDLRVHAPENVTVERIEAMFATRNFGYQKIAPIIRGTFGVVFNPQDAPITKLTPSTSTIVGIRLHSADEKYVAQFTTEGFTLSRLEPYESWEALIAEAQRVWREYKICVTPTSIHRAATRFINNLRLPLRIGDRFERFLTGMPDMPSEFPQAVSSFLQRFVIQDDATGATAVLTQALNQVPPVPPLPVILDIDVFRETLFSPDGAEVWNFLAELRKLKNRFFFGALTDEAVELYT
jgi:uncharacterized protein (TIGR04255 family)